MDETTTVNNTPNKVREAEMKFKKFVYIEPDTASSRGFRTWVYQYIEVPGSSNAIRLLEDDGWVLA